MAKIIDWFPKIIAIETKEPNRRYNYNEEEKLFLFETEKPKGKPTGDSIKRRSQR